MVKDPRIKKWMKDHEEEVERIQKRYEELSHMAGNELVEIAPEAILKKARSVLIAGIIAAEGD